MDRNIIDYKCIRAESTSKLSRQVSDLVCSAYRGGTWEPIGGVQVILRSDDTVELYQAMILVEFKRD